MLNANCCGLGVLLFCALPAVFGQPAGQYDRRLADLERKMKLLDPGFRTAAEATVTERMDALEARMDELFAARNAPAPVAAVGPAQPVQLESISTSGDYQKSADGETRLP